MVVDFAEGGNRIPRLRVFDRTMADDVETYGLPVSASFVRTSLTRIVMESG